jgi:hypothetical protein
MVFNQFMKRIKLLVFSLSPALLGIGLAGCASSHPITPQGGGYEEVGHPSRSMDEHQEMRIAFQHRAPNGKITPIWPSLYGVKEAVSGDVAIFVGDVAYVSSDPDDPKGLKPRLFAVKSPALPLDITDDVLWRWSKAWGKDPAKAQQRFSLVTPGEKDGRLELQLEFWTDEKGWPDKTALQLDWNEVTDIMSDVQAKGKRQKDLRWGTPYIAK